MYNIENAENAINNAITVLAAVSLPFASIGIYGLFNQNLTFKEIIEKIKNLISEKKYPDILEDEQLMQELEKSVKLVQEDEKYNKLCRIANAKSLNGKGLICKGSSHSGLPYIAVSYIECSEAEKEFLKNELSACIKEALEKRNFYNKILVTDTRNYYVELPAIEMRFATNEKEKQILTDALDFEAQQSLKDVIAPKDCALNNILNNFEDD